MKQEGFGASSQAPGGLGLVLKVKESELTLHTRVVGPSDLSIDDTAL